MKNHYFWSKYAIKTQYVVHIPEFHPVESLLNCPTPLRRSLLWSPPSVRAFGEGPNARPETNVQQLEFSLSWKKLSTASSKSLTQIKTERYGFLRHCLVKKSF